MTAQAVVRRIAAELGGFPERMQRVGAFVLDNPDDVALLSMREQARRAGVPPATMTRFAQRLGYTGYDELRALFAQSIRARISDFSARAEALAERRERLGEETLASTLANGLAERVSSLIDDEHLATIVEAAGVLGGARRIYCLGHRSCYAPAFHFAYVAGLYGAETRLLDAPGGLGSDRLNAAGPGDAMLAVSFAPYTRATVELAAAARDAGVAVVALTDRTHAPIATGARVTIAVPTELAEAAYVTAPAFAAAEILAGLVVAQIGPKGRTVLQRNEAAFAGRHVYWTAGKSTA